MCIYLSLDWSVKFQWAHANTCLVGTRQNWDGLIYLHALIAKNKNCGSCWIESELALLFDLLTEKGNKCCVWSWNKREVDFHIDAMPT